MKKITISQAIADIEAMFGFTESDKDHIMGSGDFLINKLIFPRYEVIDKLQGYFADKTIDGGGCWISPTTLVFTKVSIVNLDRLNELCKN